MNRSADRLAEARALLRAHDGCGQRLDRPAHRTGLRDAAARGLPAARPVAHAGRPAICRDAEQPIPSISTATPWWRSIRSAASTMASPFSMRPGWEPLRRGRARRSSISARAAATTRRRCRCWSEPGGKVFAYEIDARLADMAKRNLAPYRNVTLLHADAVKARLKRADIIYVNAGVVAPPVRWLKSSEAWRPHDLSVAA